MDFAVNISGVDETVQALLSGLDVVRADALADMLAQAAQIVVDEAVSNAPVAAEGEHVPRGHKSGTLKAKGIGYKMLNSSNAESATAAVGFTRRGFYGLFIELGTTHAGAKPFIVPAFESKKSEIFAQIGQVLSKGISDWQQGAQAGYFRKSSFSKTYNANG